MLRPLLLQNLDIVMVMDMDMVIGYVLVKAMLDMVTMASYGKRSTEPHGIAVHGHALGVAGHPGYAKSYVGPTVYGYTRGLLLGKRSADPEPTAEVDTDAHYGYTYGVYGYPYG